MLPVVDDTTVPTSTTPLQRAGKLSRGAGQRAEGWCQLRIVTGSSAGVVQTRGQLIAQRADVCGFAVAGGRRLEERVQVRLAYPHASGPDAHRG